MPTSGNLPEGIDELVEEVGTAPPAGLIGRCHQRLRAHGAAAIRALTPLLADDDRRHAIAVIIKSIAQAEPDARAAGCEAILAGLREVRPSGQAFLFDTLDQIGCGIPDPGPFPVGTRFTPIHGGVTAHHAVRDVLPRSGTKFGILYLVECHWAFSKDWVDEHGGLFSSPKGRYCYFCARTATDGVLS